VNNDAFDDLIGRTFSYKAELREARKALDAVVGGFIAAHPEIGYRVLVRRFHVSAAKLCAIARRYGHKRRPGRRDQNRQGIYGWQQRLRTSPRRPVPSNLSYTIKDYRDREHALRTLDERLNKRQVDEAGDIASQSLKRWLNEGRRRKEQRLRVKERIQQYELLRASNSE